MSTNKSEPERDAVLFAFHRECPKPSMEQISEWVERHPALATDIVEHAGLLRDWAARADDDSREIEADDVLIARGRSRALNAIFLAQRAAGSSTAIPVEATFDQLLSRAGKSIPQLSRELNIGRDVLADLVNGCMLPPVGARLVEGFRDAVGATIDTFQSAFSHARLHPRMGMAKAERQPTVVAQSYETIINRSSMPPDRKAYWLEEV